MIFILFFFILYPQKLLRKGAGGQRAGGVDNFISNFERGLTELAWPGNFSVFSSEN